MALSKAASHGTTTACIVHFRVQSLVFSSCINYDSGNSTSLFSAFVVVKLHSMDLELID